MKTKLISIAALALMTATSCCNQPEVKNVIYLIGDGMGFGAVTSLLYTEDDKTGFEQAPVIGLSETSSANDYVTDSAAGGTALATGTRTNNSFVGVDPEGNQLTSILRKAQTMGKKTGIVVNTTLTEATPASFYAGVNSRYKTYEIAKQFTESGVDVAIGAGLDRFIGRPDSLDLTATLIEKGYDVYLNWGSVLNTESDKFVGILPLADVHRREKDRSITAKAAEGQEVCLAAQLAAAAGEEVASDFSEPAVYLEKAVAKALDVLSRDSKDGYFLMIALQQARERGRTISCVSNLRQLYNYWLEYANDNKDYVLAAWKPMTPAGDLINWMEKLLLDRFNVKLGDPVPKSTGQLFSCPSDNSGNYVYNRTKIKPASYALNRGFGWGSFSGIQGCASSGGIYFSKITQRNPNTGKTIVFADNWKRAMMKGNSNAALSSDTKVALQKEYDLGIYSPHGNGMNTVFLNGSVSTVNYRWRCNWCFLGDLWNRKPTEISMVQ